MKLSYFYKIIDFSIILLLVLSAGSLLFVFNRNICYAIFLALLFLAFIFSRKKLRAREVNSALLTGVTIFILFYINFYFILLFGDSQRDGRIFFYFLFF